MNTIAKKRVGVIFGITCVLAFCCAVVCLPRTSYAAALGTEMPERLLHIHRFLTANNTTVISYLPVHTTSAFI